MKKLLGIVVLGLLLSGNAYAEKITQICKDQREPPMLQMTLTLDKSNKIVYAKHEYTDYFIKNYPNNKNPYTFDFEVLNLKDDSVTYLRRNIDRWNDSYNSTNDLSLKKTFDVNNKKSLKKLIKYNGPKYHILNETVWRYNTDGASLFQTHYPYNKSSGSSDKLFICYSNEASVKKAEDNKKQLLIKKANNEMKEEIEPFKTMCRNIGYSDGTEKFADCVKDLYLKKLDAQNQAQSQTTTTTTSKPKRRIDPSVWDDLLKMGGITSGSTSSSNSSSSSSSTFSKGTCYFTGEETIGLNKSCRYSCTGSIDTLTLKATDICPLHIQR